MGCQRFVSEDGKTWGFVCTRGRGTVYRCSVCGNPATILCDFPLKGKKEGKTCDKLLCRGCAMKLDPRDLPPGFKPPAEGDTVDVCPTHHRFVQKKKRQGDLFDRSE